MDAAGAATAHPPTATAAETQGRAHIHSGESACTTSIVSQAAVDASQVSASAVADATTNAVATNTATATTHMLAEDDAAPATSAAPEADAHQTIRKEASVSATSSYSGPLPAAAAALIEMQADSFCAAGTPAAPPKHKLGPKTTPSLSCSSSSGRTQMSAPVAAHPNAERRRRPPRPKQPKQPRTPAATATSLAATPSSVSQTHARSAASTPAQNHSDAIHKHLPASPWMGYSLEPQQPFIPQPDPRPAHHSSLEPKTASAASDPMQSVLADAPVGGPSTSTLSGLDLLSQTASIVLNIDAIEDARVVGASRAQAANSTLAHPSAQALPPSLPIPTLMPPPPLPPPWGTLTERQIMHLQACYAAYDGVPPDKAIAWISSVLGLDYTAIAAWLHARAAAHDQQQHQQQQQQQEASNGDKNNLQNCNHKSEISTNISSDDASTMSTLLKPTDVATAVAAAASPSQLLGWGLIDNNAALDYEDHRERMMEIEVSSGLRRKRNSMVMLLGGDEYDGNDGTAFILPLPLSPTKPPLPPSIR